MRRDLRFHRDHPATSFRAVATCASSVPVNFGLSTPCADGSDAMTLVYAMHHELTPMRRLPHGKAGKRKVAPPKLVADLTIRGCRPCPLSGTGIRHTEQRDATPDAEVTRRIARRQGCDRDVTAVVRHGCRTSGSIRADELCCEEVASHAVKGGLNATSTAPGWNPE